MAGPGDLLEVGENALLEVGSREMKAGPGEPLQ